MSENWKPERDTKEITMNARTTTYRPRFVARRSTPPLVIAKRDESEPCQKGTIGCCVDHSNGYDNCETW